MDLNQQLGYVKASKYRTKVLTALKDSVLCPKDISDRTQYPQSHVSNTLSDLSRQGLVVCINPDARKGRLYQLTDDGKAVCAKLAKCCA